MHLSSRRVTYLHDLADAAYCRPIVRDEARRLNHVPLIDHNPRRGEKIAFAPHEAERYPARRQAERVNSQLKDHHGGRHVRVRGHDKVYAHLMVGVLVIAAEQILRMLNEPPITLPKLFIASGAGGAGLTSGKNHENAMPASPHKAPRATKIGLLAPTTPRC